MAIHAKVADSGDIEASVRKFLLDRAANSHQTFLPFSVERISVNDTKGVTSYRAMYRTVAQSLGRPYRQTLRPIPSMQKKLHFSTVEHPLSSNQHLLDGAMLQTFYAEKISLEHPNHVSRRPRRKIILGKKVGDEQETKIPTTRKYWSKSISNDIPVELPIRDTSLVHRRKRKTDLHTSLATHHYKPFNTLLPLPAYNSQNLTLA